MSVRGRRAAWLCVAVLAAAAPAAAEERRARAEARAEASARAEERLDREHRYRVTAGEPWREVPVPAGSRAPVLGMEHPSSGALLAVTRIDYPNAAAWVARTRAAYLEEVVRGVEAAAPGYRRVAQREQMLGIVPALDLTFRRRAGAGDEVVLMRFLFFRRYTMTLTVAVPARVHRRHEAMLRAVQQSFAPYLDG